MLDLVTWIKVATKVLHKLDLAPYLALNMKDGKCGIIIAYPT